MNAEGRPPFYKLSGAGNTFAMADARVPSAYAAWEGRAKVPRASWVRGLCDASFGLGVDGVLLLQDDEAPDVLRWDFYNNDGSSAEFCGNAARCAGLFCQEVLNLGGEVQFSTIAGHVRVKELSAGRWEVLMPELKTRLLERKIESSGESYAGFAVNTGVPHFVIPLLDGQNFSAEVCAQLRRHPAWGAAGSNVTLLEIQSESSGRARTFERGVENFTAACGTGAVAAALVLANGRPGDYKVAMPGGLLEIVLGGSRPRLIGPAVVVGEFHPAAEVLR